MVQLPGHPRHRPIRTSASHRNRKKKETHSDDNCSLLVSINAERTGWDLVPEKVAVVKRIYQMAMDGEGTPTIAKHLNADEVPTLVRAKYWDAGVTAAVLRNSAVIRRYTPKKADAPAIDGYYPEIIPPETFYRVQEFIKARRWTPGQEVRMLQICSVS